MHPKAGRYPLQSASPGSQPLGPHGSFAPPLFEQRRHVAAVRRLQLHHRADSLLERADSAKAPAIPLDEQSRVGAVLSVGTDGGLQPRCRQVHTGALGMRRVGGHDLDLVAQEILLLLVVLAHTRDELIDLLKHRFAVGRVMDDVAPFGPGL
eukprot:4692628-Prymnesium_polylepis.1